MLFERAGNRAYENGSGGAFIDHVDSEGFDFFSPRGYDKIYREGKKVPSNLIDISVPMIAAVDGPATVHSEYVLLADIVIATRDTVLGQGALRLRDPFALAGGHWLHPWPHVRAHATDHRRRASEGARRGQRDRSAPASWIGHARSRGASRTSCRILLFAESGPRQGTARRRVESTDGRRDNHDRPKRTMRRSIENRQPRAT
jgi:hypothetical protein